MPASLARAALGAGLIGLAGMALANTTHSAFADVAGAAATDGFNELYSSRISTAQLVAGLDGNSVDTGGSVFRRLSGGFYPASFGLYSWSTDSAFSFSVADSVDGLSRVALQTFISVDTSQGVEGLLHAGYLPTLSFNGGSQALAPSYSMTPVSGGFAMDGSPLAASASNPNYGQFSWDLSGVGSAVESFTISFGIDTHANALAFQLDQVAAVPEPGTWALGLVGLGLCGAAGVRRQRAKGCA